MQAHAKNVLYVRQHPRGKGELCTIEQHPQFKLKVFL